MKNALIAAVVSAIVAAASGTAATILVTSKNIKNGTIQTVDISAKAKKALRGQRGPRGLQEVTLVTSSPLSVAPGTPNARVEATCPDGERPISGGFQATGVPTISSSAPNLAGRSWAVIANSVNVPASVTAFVYCAPNVTISPLGP